MKTQAPAPSPSPLGNMELKENKEEQTRTIESALLLASQTPYNNAAVHYYKRGIVPDSRFGGSCLHKLAVLKNELPTNVSLRTIATQDKVHHFSALVDSNNQTLYLDPFLWQAAPLILGEQREAPTIFSNLTIVHKSTDLKTKLPVIDLVANAGTENSKILKSHSFSRYVDPTPSPETEETKPGLPSFQIQTHYNGKRLNVWYNKKEKELGDIWEVSGEDGSRKKYSQDDRFSSDRLSVLKTINEALSIDTTKELLDYFHQAAELEKLPGQTVKPFTFG